MKLPTHGPSGGQDGGAVAQTRAVRVLEQIQDVVTVLVGGALLVLSLGILIAAVVDFVRSHSGVITAATGFLDQVLLVLILVEVVHTVILSLRAHALQAEPFIVVALIAAIRKILFVLGSQQPISTAQFALFLATAVVFVASLVVIRRLGGRQDAE